jgi:quercetin dioxygenase-like cupin family protein
MRSHECHRLDYKNHTEHTGDVAESLIPSSFSAKGGFMLAKSGGLTVNPCHEIIHIGALTVRFLMTGEHSGGTVAAFELIVPSERGLPVPAHSHAHFEETIYGIEGRLSWTVDENKIDVGPAEMLCIPRCAVHRFENHGGRDARALCIITPAAIGPQYFRESAVVVNAAAGGPPDHAKLEEIMRRHGLTPAQTRA